jgi:MFS family permease
MSQITSSEGETTQSGNNLILFWASFFTLVAAGIGFSVRGAVVGDWGTQFGFTQTELGTLTGGGLIGFGVAIIFFSFFADRFGYGKLMIVAFLLHASSAVLTFAATPVFEAYGKEAAFKCLNAGMWLFAFGNGTCEAVINPLTATLFPKNKTHWLNILHAGWPLGLILGALITLGFEEFLVGIRWEYKLGVFLIPVLLYGIMMFNRTFPKSEAKTAGVPMSDMMKHVGMLGFTLATALIGLALVNLLDTVFDLNKPWIGWVVAGCIWLVFAVATNFSLGSWLLAFLYIMHAGVGYVELGTDSWITNITTEVLGSKTNALLAFIWTNLLMFTLRFFAGPIVHRINPLGLLFFSAAMGVVGLYCLGQDFTNSIWPWLGAVTIYGIGKTFYWPTLLGVISERFPKGGALALGISGGVGMIGAGILGGPGIGYKQDLFAVEKLQETREGEKTYQHYMALNKDGKPDLKGFPYLTDIFPKQIPLVAGIDNSKYDAFKEFRGILNDIRVAQEAKKPPEEMPVVLADSALLDDKPEGTREIMLDYKGSKITLRVTFVTQAFYDKTWPEERKKKYKEEKKPIQPLLKITLQSDWETLQREKSAGHPVKEATEQTITKLHTWWYTEGLPHFGDDQVELEKARLYGAKQALFYTMFVPAGLAIGFFLLIIYFALTGGYKQIHIDDPHGGMSLSATPE